MKKKLALSRETIRMLASTELERAVGGAAQTEELTNCPSFNTCLSDCACPKQSSFTRCIDRC